MMAEIPDWDDAATMVRDSSSGGDAWHVAVTPDEIKVVSLDQLDDMFRLSLIDAQTKVWQPGMSEWLSLGVVAGLDDKPAPPPPPKRNHPKPPSPRTAPPQAAPLAARSAAAATLPPTR